MFIAYLAAAFGNSGGNEPWKIAIHMGIYGAVIIVPAVFVGGLLGYGLARAFGFATRLTAYAWAGALSLVYPALVAIQNEHKPGFVTLWYYVACLICGLVAARVFCKIVGIGLTKQH